MPYIDVKLFDHRLADEEAVAKVVEALTNGLCEALGEQVRDSTWVVVQGVPPRQWGIGGKAQG